jgi:hypothetical protein
MPIPNNFPQPSSPPKCQPPPIMETTNPIDTPSPPSILNFILGFLIVGLAWGFTTPFIRRAAVSHNPPPHPILQRPSIKSSWIRTKIYSTFFSVTDLLKNWRYALPLVINLTGSIWFFLLIGKAGEFPLLFFWVFELAIWE